MRRVFFFQGLPAKDPQPSPSRPGRSLSCSLLEEPPVEEPAQEEEEEEEEEAVAVAQAGAVGLTPKMVWHMATSIWRPFKDLYNI